MAYDEDVRDDVFERLAGYVRWSNELGAMEAKLNDVLDQATAAFSIASSPSDEDRQSYENFCAEILRQRQEIESMRATVVSQVSEFANTDMKKLLKAPCTSASEILAYLADLMDDNDHTVLANDVSATVTADEDNSVTADDAHDLLTATATQLTRNDEIRLVCTDDSTVGQERWSLTSSSLGRYSGEVVTGTPTDWTEAGLEDLTVNAAPNHAFEGQCVVTPSGSVSTVISDIVLYGVGGGLSVGGQDDMYLHVAYSSPDTTIELRTAPGGTVVASCTVADTGGTDVNLTEQNNSGISGTITFSNATNDELFAVAAKVSDLTMPAALRSTHTDADGRVYCRLSTQDLAVASDSLGQTSGFGFSSLELGTETDVNGKLYVSVVKEPSGYVVGNSSNATIDPADIVLDGITGSNSDNGTLYATVTESAGTYTVDLYSHADRIETEGPPAVHHLVASSDSQALETELVLSEANTSGITGGTVKVSGFIGNDPDETLTIQVPRYVVRVYRSAARSDEDLVCEGVAYEPAAGSVTLSAANGFSAAGSVTLNYIQDDESIVVTAGMDIIDLYRADPDDSATGDEDIVARAGQASGLLDNAGVVALPFYAVNQSGLADATVKVQVGTVSAGAMCSFLVGYAKGDAFQIVTSSDDEGNFQTFLREGFNVCLPGASTGASVSDSATEILAYNGRYDFSYYSQQWDEMEQDPPDPDYHSVNEIDASLDAVDGLVFYDFEVVLSNMLLVQAVYDDGSTSAWDGFMLGNGYDEDKYVPRIIVASQGRRIVGWNTTFGNAAIPGDGAWEVSITALRIES